ncbi:hypothetical protein KAR91_74270 [Candidatus Pacearchaeota archaeon]|nr:hypothetical protein [Candidatus Pacearchaeota archaeon]
MTTKQREYARKVIKKHYRLNRQPTDTEIDAEIINLQRKAKFGGLVDSQERLAAQLSTGQHPIKIWDLK